MLTNADCTVYEFNETSKSLERHVIKEVYWNDSRGMTLSRNGVQISDSALVFVYESSYIPKNGDIIIKGEISDTYDGSTQQAQSQSMKALRAAHPDFAVIKNVADARYGGLPHIEITAR